MNKFVKYLSSVCVLLLFLAPMSSFAASTCPTSVNPTVVVKSSSTNPLMIRQLLNCTNSTSLEQLLKKCNGTALQQLLKNVNSSKCNIKTTKPTAKTAKPTTTTTKPTTSTTKPTTTTAAPATGSFQNQVVTIVNQERAKNGLKPLTVNATLTKVAQTKAQDMYQNKYFSHTSPTYGSPFDMMKQFGVSYRSAGENIAMGQKTPQEVMNGWMNSPGHRANILNSSYTQIGVGYVNGYWVQEFIGN